MEGETANLFVRPELFDRVDGLDESLPSAANREFVRRRVAVDAGMALARDAVAWYPTTDRARARIHRARGARATPARRRRLWINTFYLPIIGMVRSRRAAGRSLRLDRSHLAENNVRALLRDVLRALAIFYFVLTHFAGVRKLVGTAELSATRTNCPTDGRTTSRSREAGRIEGGLELTRVANASPGALAVSVIIPVRNGGGGLGELIAALEAQTVERGHFDVVIGDDGSTDGCAEGLATADGWVRVVGGPPQTSYAARNRAVLASSAPVLAFCDADCRPDPAWLEAGLTAVERADLVGGLIRHIVSERPTLWSLLDMDIFLDQERAVRSGHAVTANLFARREIFERVGGFDPSLPNHGDFDFVARSVAAGARLAFSPEAIVWHPTRDSADEVLRKVWRVNRQYAVRETRAGRRPWALRARSWVPLFEPLLARKRSRRSLRPDRKRLVSSEVEPRLVQDILALPIMYIVVPYLARLAQVRGWWVGRRARTIPALSTDRTEPGCG